MARPKKIGIDYFPLDVDMFEDEKILPALITNQHAENIIIRLMCALYRNGYYIEYNTGIKTKIAYKGRVKVDDIDEVVQALLESGFFNHKLYLEHRILTSKGIQERWRIAVRKRVLGVELEYWLLDEPSVKKEEETPKRAEETPKKEPENPQKKVKESKVNEKKVSKGKRGETPPLIPTNKLPSVNYNSVINLYHEKCPTMPRVTVLSEHRKRAIRARIKELGMASVVIMLKIAGESKFLNGNNKINWSADFDWLFSPKNFVKVIEGNYSKNNEGYAKDKSNNSKEKLLADFEQRIKTTMGGQGS
jgi:hypothetical protein